MEEDGCSFFTLYIHILPCTFADQQPANSLSRSHVAVSLGDHNLVESADRLCKALGKMSLVGNDAKCHNGESVYKYSSLLVKEQALCVASGLFPGGLSGPGSPGLPTHLSHWRVTCSPAVKQGEEFGHLCHWQWFPFLKGSSESDGCAGDWCWILTFH